MTGKPDAEDGPRQSYLNIGPRDSRSEVLDFAADMAHDAVEFGEVSPSDVASALEEAADEVRRAANKEEA